jgi:hypothetical protein
LLLLVLANAAFARMGQGSGLVATLKLRLRRAQGWLAVAAGLIFAVLGASL